MRRAPLPRSRTTRLALAAIAIAAMLAACDEVEEAPPPPAPSAAPSAALGQPEEGGSPAAAPSPSAEMAQSGEAAGGSLTEARRRRIAAMAADWPPEPPMVVSFDAIDPNVRVQDFAAAAKFDPTDDYYGLPRTDGYELVAAYCTGCHSARIVMQQRGTEERWAALLDWMVAEQGMLPLPGDEEEMVHAYLVEHFGAGTDPTP